MKRAFFILSYLLFSLILLAQTTKTDVIQKANGEELKGKITEVSDSEVKFIYAGETAVYVIKKSDIQKITYASGRVETFTAPPAPSQTPPSTPVVTGTEKPTIPTPSAEEVRNKVAVLPFTFLKQNEDAGDAISYKVQQDAYDYLSKHSGLYTYLDPRTTNALLIKAGVNKNTIMGYTMSELCNILAVEYLVTGTVTQAKSSSTSSSYNNTNVKTDSKNSNKGTISGSSSSSSYDNYGITVAVEVFNNKDAKVFSDSHKRFMDSPTADYTDPLHYVLKRAPLYSK